MLTVKCFHWDVEVYDGDCHERIELPVTLLDHTIELTRSEDCFDYNIVVSPSLDERELSLLRRAMTEWDHDDWLGLEEEVGFIG